VRVVRACVRACVLVVVVVGPKGCRIRKANWTPASPGVV
jgi:hypothetical protein